MHEMKEGTLLRCVSAEPFWLEHKLLTIGKIYKVQKVGDSSSLWIIDDRGTKRNHYLWMFGISITKFVLVSNSPTEEVE